MWVKRSDTEINAFIDQRARKRKSLVRPLVYGAIWASVITTAHYLGFRGGGRGFYFFARHSRFDQLTVFVSVLAFLLISGFVYYRQRRGLKFFVTMNDSMLCGECQEPSSPNIENKCGCGGQLEPFEYYTWEEDEGGDAATHQVLTELRG